MLKSLGKKSSSPSRAALPVKAKICYSKSSYIAGDTVSGRVTLTYTPDIMPPPKGSHKTTPATSSAAALRAAAVQLLVTGTERTDVADARGSTPTVHLYRTYTIAGQKDPEEATTEVHQTLREEAYLQSNARYAPLTGVVLSTAPGDRNTSGEVQTRSGGRGDRKTASHTAQASACGTSDDLPLSEPQSPGVVKLSMGGDVLLKGGERYVVPFTFRLPPWLPPSYYCHFGDVKASLEYVVQVHIKCTEPSATTATSDEVVLREPLMVISSIPLREVLQCYERANLKPAFTLRYRFRQFHSSSLRRLVSPGPQSPIDVVVEFLSSSTVLLRDRKKALAYMLHPESAATASTSSAGATSSGPSSPVLGTTVMGNVVMPDSATPTKRRKYSSEALQAVPDPIGCLHLRVTVSNGTDTRTVDNTKSGGSTIKSIGIQLQSRVLVSAGNRDFASPPFVLSKAEVGGNVPLGTSNTFKVKLPISASQFRRAKNSGDSDLSPPTNISSLHTTVSTSLVFTFPGLETIPEDQPMTNVIVLAEAMDESNRVPYLPNDWRKYETYTDNNNTSRNFAA